MTPFYALALILIGTVCSASSLYDNSTESPHLALIQSAQKTIDIEVYTMADLQIQSAILQAQSRGVQVRIIQEPAPVGDACKIFTAASSKDSAACSCLKSFLANVISGGGTYIPYNKAAFCNGKKECYEHGKIMIIDRQLALVSTGNFDPTSICDKSEKVSRCNRDFSVVTNDVSEVLNLETVFESDLVGQTYDLQSFVNSLPKSTLTVSPYSLSPLVSFIESAKISLQIENQYLDDADLNQAIEAAAQRGVAVTVMVSSICSFGKATPSAQAKLRSLASEFSAAGVNARAFTKNIQVNGVAGYLHAKTMVVDGKEAWVGSVNGSATALNVNREFGIFTSDASSVQSLQQILESDFSSAGGTALFDDANCSGN